MDKQKQIEAICNDLEELSLASNYSTNTFTNMFLSNASEYRISYFSSKDFNENPLLQDSNYHFWSFRVLVSQNNSQEACTKLKQLAGILSSLRVLKIADLRHFQITSNLIEYILVLSNRNYPIIVANHIVANYASSGTDVYHTYDAQRLIYDRNIDHDSASYYTAKRCIMHTDHTKSISMPYVLGIDKQGNPVNSHYFDNVVDVNDQAIDYDKLKQIFKNYLQTRLTQYQNADKNNSKLAYVTAEIIPPIALVFNPQNINRDMFSVLFDETITKEELAKHAELIKYLADFV